MSQGTEAKKMMSNEFGRIDPNMVTGTHYKEMLDMIEKLDNYEFLKLLYQLRELRGDLE